MAAVTESWGKKKEGCKSRQCNPLSCPLSCPFISNSIYLVDLIPAMVLITPEQAIFYVLPYHPHTTSEKAEELLKAIENTRTLKSATKTTLRNRFCAQRKV